MSGQRQDHFTAEFISESAAGQAVCWYIYYPGTRGGV